MVRGLVLTFAVGALSSLAACGGSEVFACQADEQCVIEMIPGMCEPNGLCSFPDPECPSGSRYGQSAGELSGTCVDVEPSGSGSAEGPAESGSTPLGTTSSTTADASTTTLAITSGVDSSTSDPPLSTTGPELTTSGSTGPEPENPYAQCESDQDCPVPGSQCPGVFGFNACAPPCEGPGDECPAPLDGTAPAMCVPLPRAPGCMLSCGGSSCPAGMACDESFGFPVCTWP